LGNVRADLGQPLALYVIQKFVLGWRMPHPPDGRYILAAAAHPGTGTGVYRVDCRAALDQTAKLVV
jgi:hypothetical protein